MSTLTEKVLEKENLESNLRQVEGRLADMEFELGEVEKQRDLVGEQCNALEQQLVEAKQQGKEEGDVLRQQLREVEQRSLDKENILSQRLQQVEQELEAAKQTQEKAKELEAKLKNSSQAMEEVDLARAKLVELEKVIEDLKYEVEETEKQRDAVDAACDKLEEEKNAIKEKLVDQDKLEQEKKVLVQKLLEQKQYSDKMYELNLRLQGGQELSLGVVEDKAVLVKQLEEVKANRREVLDKLEKVKEELGRKNIAFASLKVDVEKGELEYKKKCEVLQSDLDYEKAVVARLTQDARRLQANAMETTVVAPRAAVAATNTSALPDSPIWSSGSGAIKEIRLHEAEMKVKSLESEVKKVKEHEEHYMNKAKEWKNRCLKYERTLVKNQIPVPGKENLPSQPTSDAPQPPTIETPRLEEKLVKESATPSAALDQRRPPLTNLQKLSRHNAAIEGANTSVTPTEDLQLVLDRNLPSRPTEKDFKLPPSAAKKDDCKTQ